jgi:nucleoside-diphosphate-sugar epimerase
MPIASARLWLPYRSIMPQLRCAITGANGYVGGIVCRSLEQAGITAVKLHRRAAEGPHERRFSLDEPIDAAVLQGVDALVHCAWDFKATSWKQIQAVNVAGSLRLFETARAAGVQRQVFISTMSAFPGCRSLYGKAKLEVETQAVPRGVDIVRPGLVYGDHPGGMMGSLAQLTKLPILPVVGNRRSLLYLAHEDDLGTLVARLSANAIPRQAKPIVAAHPHGRTLREILHLLANARGKRVLFVPVPWRLAWAGLKCVETLGLRCRLRSDGLVGMMNLETHPNFDVAEAVGATFRDFSPKSPA